VAQFFVNAPNTSGGSSPATWWTFFGLSVVLYFIAIIADIIELGMVSCCSGLITGIVALTLSFNTNKQTMILQSMPHAPQVVVQPIVQQQIPTQYPQVSPNRQPPSQTIMPSKSMPKRPDLSQSIAQQARNMELARDFEGAANLYQKAGLFGEAGRIRKEHLEKDASPMVQIGHVGDSVVNDSVIMNETDSHLACSSCGMSIQPDWKFCPGCNSHIG
jgi:hypothetical protein